MNESSHLATLLWTVVYVGLGVSIFGVSFWLLTKVLPFSVRDEIEKDQNTALGIVLGAFIIGLAIIIAAGIS
jgi:uncharacterized membrane protein YjfL (UPF0719 family)